MLLLRGPAHHTDAIHTLDLALILAGAPGPHRRSTIHTLLESIPTAAAAAEAPALTKNPIRDPPPTISHPIPRLPRPSLHAFQTHLDTQDSPLIVTHALTHWRALASWPHPRYLLSLTHGGRRLVPVEVGRAYTDSGWGQRIIPFAEFWSTFMGADAAEKGYLAQHTLLSQVPALRDDIAIPDYCYTTPPATGAPALEEPLIHAWLGPRGTVSPLHTDPYANMLAQVVGSKYVRVYAPGERVFPRGVEAGGVDMGNTSRGEVEVEGGGLEEEEERRVWGETSYLEAVLEPGEVLFIPAGWWHYVRSLEESFSVSFWWN